MKQHITTIDTTQATTKVTRNTGPLVQSVSVPDPFSMEIEIMRQPERVTVPGVLLHDPEFVGGYVCGRASYFAEVSKFVDQAGHIVESFTESQLPCITSMKVRDITDQDAANFITETIAWEYEELAGETIPLACRAGFIFGYVHACIETAQTREEGFPYNVASDTAHHRIEVQEGCLSIGEQRFPDHCVSLSPEETDQALEVLLIAQNGFTPVPNQETAA